MGQGVSAPLLHHITTLSTSGSRIVNHIVNLGIVSGQQKSCSLVVSAGAGVVEGRFGKGGVNVGLAAEILSTTSGSNLETVREHVHRGSPEIR